MEAYEVHQIAERADGFRELGMPSEAFEEFRDVKLSDLRDSEIAVAYFELAGEVRAWHLVQAVQEELSDDWPSETKVAASGFLNRFTRHLMDCADEVNALSKRLLRLSDEEPKNHLN